MRPSFHVLYCLAAAAMMALLVKYAWPEHLADDGGNGDAA